MLVSYAHTEEVSLMSTDTSGTRRVFALVRLSVYGDTFKIESTKTVPYQTVSQCSLSFASSFLTFLKTATSGAPTHPRIQFLANGAVVVVQFGDAVALIARGTQLSCQS